jgi:Kef-type K+ transport system membrane component KefB
VAMTVGGTIFTDIASMLVLAIAVSVHINGFSWRFLVIELVELAIYVPLVLFGTGSLARKAIIRFGEKAEVRVMILLVIIAACAELAQLIQLEGIVGAFLAGIAVKRAVRGKFAVEALDVTAHALFIPTFFLATGFLVNLHLLGKTAVSRPDLVGGIIAALFIGKYLGARLSIFSLAEQRQKPVSSGVSPSPQMAATLASAVVVYKTMNASGDRLLDEVYLNVLLVLIVLTCVAGPVESALRAKLRSAIKTNGIAMPEIPSFISRGEKNSGPGEQFKVQEHRRISSDFASLGTPMIRKAP